MRYADNWIKVDIENLNLEKVLAWCSDNIKGKQFIEGNVIKFEFQDDAIQFQKEYKD